MRNLDFGRRRFLRSTTAAWVFLPFLRKSVAASSLAKRFVAIYMPVGAVPAQWYPQPVDDPTRFVMSPSLEPLEKYRKEIVVLDGIANKAARIGGSDHHCSGMGSLLSGWGSEKSHGEYNRGRTVDQVLADTLSKDRPFRSLELSARITGDYTAPKNRWIYNLPYTPLAPVTNPCQVQKKLLGLLPDTLGGGESEAQMNERLSRQTAMSALKADIDLFQKTIIGVDEREHFQAHVHSVVEMERQLLQVASSAGGGAFTKDSSGFRAVSCSADEQRGTPNHYPAMVRLQMDLMVLALKCDLTRVASLQLSYCNSEVVHRQLPGQTLGHHEASHLSDAAGTVKYAAINRWYVEQFAYLVEKMSMVNLGGRSLLSDSIVLVGSDTGDGRSHKHDRMPFLLFGQGGGALRTGRLVNAGNVPHNNLLVSLLNKFDVPAMTFGDPSVCTGSIAAL